MSKTSTTHTDVDAVHQVFSITERGRREQNEDRVLSKTSIVDGHHMSLVAVADGMGGHAGGEVASDIAMGTLLEWWDALDPSLDAHLLRQSLTNAFAGANARIGQHGASHKDVEGLGTTLAAILVIDNRAVVANVGDSRAYRVRRDSIDQVSIDHSAGAEALRNGLLPEKIIRKSPFQNALTRSLDGSEDFDVDVFPFEKEWFMLSSNEILLVCSDGLTGHVSDVELFEELLTSPNLELGCGNLVQRAYRQGSQDNISIGCIEVGQFTRIHDGRRDTDGTGENLGGIPNQESDRSAVSVDSGESIWGRLARRLHLVRK